MRDLPCDTTDERSLLAELDQKNPDQLVTFDSCSPTALRIFEYRGLELVAILSGAKCLMPLFGDCHQSNEVSNFAPQTS